MHAVHIGVHSHTTYYNISLALLTTYIMRAVNTVTTSHITYYKISMTTLSHKEIHIILPHSYYTIVLLNFLTNFTMLSVITVILYSLTQLTSM
jgi:hypothetical protein